LGSCSLPPFSSSSLLPFLPDHPSESPEAKNLPVFREGVGTSTKGSVTAPLDKGRQLSFTEKEREKEKERDRETETESLATIFVAILKINKIL